MMMIIIKGNLGGARYYRYCATAVPLPRYRAVLL